tara:strand:+ start:3615 stop:3815 length:201 start_codon:yes stop_codon:yes gene_type:complete
MNYCICECDPYAFWDISYKQYMEMTPIKRMEYLKSLRLLITKEREQEKRQEIRRKLALDIWLKKKV